MNPSNITDMQISTCRHDAGLLRLTSLIMLLGMFLLLSCREKEEPHIPPGMKFIADPGFTTHDTVIVAGQKIRVGIQAWGNDAGITYFSIRYNDGSPKIVLDTGMNRSRLTYTVDIIKTSSAVETWTFFIMDRNRQTDSARIVLTKSLDSKWGKIRTLPDVTLGAQERSDTGSFFSFSSGQVFTLGGAFMNQPLIGMIYYYGLYQGTFASPAEAEAPGFFTGTQGIAGWTIRNETRYDTTSVSPAAFDLAANDSLLLSAYDPSAGKRKAKFITPGMVVAFKSPDGKLGLIKVSTLSGTTAGTMKFTVKIQE